MRNKDDDYIRRRTDGILIIIIIIMVNCADCFFFDFLAAFTSRFVAFIIVIEYVVDGEKRNAHRRAQKCLRKTVENRRSVYIRKLHTYYVYTSTRIIMHLLSTYVIITIVGQIFGGYGARHDPIF